jgi:4-hydroxysphinganine ceramide fatty acyl 2-hydroxylase
MLTQLLNTKWTLKDYLEYLDEPKILINPWRSIILFDNPLLEAITIAPWYMIPLGILPIAWFLLTLNELNFESTLALFSAGVLTWTFAEYTLHRFVFHSEQYWLPDHPTAIAYHFVLNGLHHAFPQDANRLVYPIIPAYLVIGTCIFPLPYFLLPRAWFYSFFAGLLCMYVCYECIHFFMHFGKTSSRFLKNFKVLHNEHHYRQAENGFGVSIAFWDIIFGTQLKM